MYPSWFKGLAWKDCHLKYQGVVKSLDLMPLLLYSSNRKFVMFALNVCPKSRVEFQENMGRFGKK